MYEKLICSISFAFSHCGGCVFHNGFISYEEWCEYLAKVDMTDEDENCSYDCGANIDGKCKYAVNRNKAATALLMEV